MYRPQLNEIVYVPRMKKCGRASYIGFYYNLVRIEFDSTYTNVWLANIEYLWSGECLHGELDVHATRK